MLHRSKAYLKSVTILVLFSFLFTGIAPYAPAQTVVLPPVNEFVNVSYAFSLPVLRGIRFDPKDPLAIEFIVDTADKSAVTEQEAAPLIRYFLAALTIPEEDIWVNLSPYEKGKIAPKSLGVTDLGRDLLSQDYVLKQLLSSLTYPESDTGRTYWEKTYQEISRIAGTTNVPVNTFNKIWIVPREAQVYENGTVALITSATMQAMLEEDYVSLRNNISKIQQESASLDAASVEDINSASSRMLKEVVLPKINKDINEGRNFATLRQIYHSLILGVWFKKKFKDSLYAHYINQGKVTGIDLEDPTVKDKIYNQYVKAFEKGLYDYIKTDKDPATGKNIKRRYYSGGFSLLATGPTGISAAGAGTAMGEGLEWMRTIDVLPSGVRSASDVFMGNDVGIVARLTTAGQSSVAADEYIEEEYAAASSSLAADTQAQAVRDTILSGYSLKQRAQRKFEDAVIWLTSKKVKDTSIVDWTMKGKTLPEVVGQVVKEYDVRGYDGYGDETKYPQQFDATLLRAFGRAIGSTEFASQVHEQIVRLKPGDTFLIAGDNGPSTPEFRENIREGLRDTGVNVIDLGACASGELYSSIARFNAQGGMYITRSHVEIGTNGFKPVVGRITLYAEMLSAIKEQMLSGQFRQARRRGRLDNSGMTRAQSRVKYLQALSAETADLSRILSKAPIKIAVNFGGGSLADKDYVDFTKQTFGEHLIRVFREESDPLAEQGGLPDPSRYDQLADEKLDIMEYSRQNPDVLVFNFDLDADRVSVVWDGQLYLGDEMFYPVVEYMLTLDKYKDKNKTFFIDSRMKTEMRDLIEALGGIAKLHPKGHSKVKASMDVLLKEIAAKENLTVDAFLKKYPDFKMAQAEYSLHMFLSNKRGESFDDAFRFMFFWAKAFAAIKEKYDNPALDLAGYISQLKSEGLINETYQLKEQRFPMPDAAKKLVMRKMTENVAFFFEGSDLFRYLTDWRSFEGRDVPFMLVDIDGVFHLMSPAGDAFWGWSNTSPKDAFGIQSTDPGLRRELTDIIGALLVHSRNEVAGELGMELPQIEDKETKDLAALYEVSATETQSAAAQIEAAWIEKYPTIDSALSALKDNDFVSSSSLNKVILTSGQSSIADAEAEVRGLKPHDTFDISDIEGGADAFKAALDKLREQNGFSNVNVRTRELNKLMAFLSIRVGNFSSFDVFYSHEEKKLYVDYNLLKEENQTDLIRALNEAVTIRMVSRGMNAASSGLGKVKNIPKFSTDGYFVMAEPETSDAAILADAKRGFQYARDGFSYRADEISAIRAALAVAESDTQLISVEALGALKQILIHTKVVAGDFKSFDAFFTDNENISSLSAPALLLSDTFLGDAKNPQGQKALIRALKEIPAMRGVIGQDSQGAISSPAVSTTSVFLPGVGTIPTIEGIDFSRKSVVMRVDFNLPVKDVVFGTGDTVVDFDFLSTERVKAAIPSIVHILKQNPKRLILVTHFAPKVRAKQKAKLSTEKIAQVLEDELPAEYRKLVRFMRGSVDKQGLSQAAIYKDIPALEHSEVALLQNIRFADGETKGDEELSKQLSQLADVYVIEAFGTAHRQHASMMPQDVPAAAGFLVEKEVAKLSKAVAPEHPFDFIAGGAKVEDKVDILENIIDVMQSGDKILVGGAMANTFLKAKDSRINLGSSLVGEPDKVELAAKLLREAENKGVKIILPVDHITATELSRGALAISSLDENVSGGYMSVDIGPATQQRYIDALQGARTIVWNGPMGAFEEHKGGFAEGSYAIARELDRLAGLATEIVIAGGETVAVAQDAGVSSEDVFMSTGGGSAMEFLGNKGRLPVLEHLAAISQSSSSSSALAYHDMKKSPEYGGIDFKGMDEMVQAEPGSQVAAFDIDPENFNGFTFDIIAINDIEDIDSTIGIARVGDNQYSALYR